MKLVDTTSLAATLEAMNDALFNERSLTRSEKQETAKWIATRQGRPGAYAGMFAPTEKDMNEGARLLTGEKVRSGAGLRHVLGEEACRALILLDAPLADARDSLARATVGMTDRLREYEGRCLAEGVYCCGTCTVSLWRHLTAGGLADAHPDEWLAAGLKCLKRHRDGKGRWRRFPFYYTLLALTEIDLPDAMKELRYAAPVCKRVLRRSTKGDVISRRRRLLAESVLVKC